MVRFVLFAVALSQGVLAELPRECTTSDCFGPADGGNVLLQRENRKLVAKEKVASLALGSTRDPVAASAGSDDFTPEGAATLFFTVLGFLLVASFIQQRRYINVSDDVQEESTERSKRMAKQSMNLALAMEKDSTAEVFRRENIMLAVRAGCALVLAGSISFVHPLEQWFSSMSYDVTYVGVLVLWTMGRSIGETVSGLWDAVIGTVVAFFWIWLIEGVSPNGIHTGDPSEKWMFGVAYLVFTTFIMMFGTWRNGMRVWCLSYHMGNMMAWLTPTERGVDDGYSHHFQIKFDGAAFGYVIVTLFAAVVTILALSLPTPRMAHRIALRDMSNSVNSFDSLFRCLVKLYCGHTNSADSDLQRCKIFEHNMEGDLAGLQTQIDASWWEHFDMGQFADIRKALSKHATVQQGLMEISCSILECLSSLPTTDDTTKLRSQIEPSMDYLVESTLTLYQTCYKAMENGAVDEQEANEMTEKIGVVEDDIDKLSKSFRTAAAELAGQGFCKQQEMFRSDWEMVFLLCSLSRMIADTAKDTAARNPRTSVSAVQALFSFNIFRGVTDQDHLEFAFRNSLSLAACWVIGYNGVFGLLAPHTAGIATNASLLMSTAVGSALKKNMGRVQGLVLGTTVGTLMYGAVISQGCQEAMYFFLGYGLTFVLGTASFFLFVSCKENSFIFYLFGGFAAQRLLSPCTSEITETDLAGFFKNILCAIICVSILATVDLAMTPSAGKLAQQKAVGLARSISHCITLIMKDMQAPQAAYRKVALRSEINDVAAKAIEGAAEPRLMSQPFNGGLYSLVVDKTRRILIQILTYRWAIRHSASSTLDDAPASRKKGDSAIFPIFEACKVMPSLHESIAQMLDTFVCNIESQACANSAMDSARANLDMIPCYPKVREQIEQLRLEIGPKVDAQHSEMKPLDKDVSASIHVMFTVFETYVNLLDELEVETAVAS